MPVDSDSSRSASKDDQTPAEDAFAGRIVTHTRMGVWDFYEEQNPDSGTALSFGHWRKKLTNMFGSYPYLWRMLVDVLHIPGCKSKFALFFTTELVSALIPAASIW